MFYITPDDIAALETDAFLRELIRRLCEADLRSKSLPSSAVTAGGHQDAADGGIDVRVRLEPGQDIEGFIPRFSTGFQVKKQDMPAGEIEAEMRPKGIIRQSIQNLANEGGAYIIVSSDGSVADEPLQRRMAAMTAAIMGIPNANALRVDFYDRTRVASWASEHASVRLWLKRAIGRATPGWEPFAAWANPSGRLDEEYIVDEGLRIVRRPGNEEDGEQPVNSGITTIRHVLSAERASIRLVGLSGLGKTRLVQALFDARIGHDALDPSLAIYTNLGNQPDPQPFNLVSDLVETGMRNIVVIDNCTPELHLQLTAIVRKASSKISLLTIEYDIRDDQPDNTEVFELKPSSDSLIEKLLEKRYPHLSQVNARAIAEFAGGNARVGLALADTVGKSGTLANLSNDQLFQRLFVQRHHYDKPLQVMAEALSLLYSFDGEGFDNSSELATLGAFVDASPKQMFSAVGELLDRNLAQSRGKWRAILPHAIANRLAEGALRKIPASLVESVFLSAGERMLRSFSRRLGYLHQSPEAKEIVGNWLAQDGLCGNVLELNSVSQAVFSNIIPVDSAGALAAIERSINAAVLSPPVDAGRFVVHAIRALAYDAPLFVRAAELLKKVATFGNERCKKEAADAHASLFTIYLSGTCATPIQRATVIRDLLNAGSREEQQLGLAALDKMLEGGPFMSSYDFSFGGHSRDYGLQPKDYADVRKWYGAALQIVQEYSEGSLAYEVKTKFAENFRGVWQRGWFWDEFELAIAHIAQRGFWREGWLAVQETMKYGSGGKGTDSYKRLEALAKLLNPNNLIDEIRGRAFSRKGGSYDLEDGEEDEDEKDFQTVQERRTQRLVQLGERLVTDVAAFEQLLPEIVTASGLPQVLAIGLAKGSKDLRGDWNKLVDAYSQAPVETRTENALWGFIGEVGRIDPPLAHTLLDAAVSSDVLAERFVLLQVSVDLDERGADRLITALKFGKAPIWTYVNLSAGRVTDRLKPGELAAVLREMLGYEGGPNCAAQILYMHFHGDGAENGAIPEETKRIGLEILDRYDLKAHTRHEDHYIAKVARKCLVGEAGKVAAAKLCKRIRSALDAREAHVYELGDLIQQIFASQPRAALDEIFSGDAQALQKTVGNLQFVSALHKPSLLAKIDNQVLIEWCEVAPAVRYPIVASTGDIFVFQDKSVIGWSSLASELIKQAPDPVAVVHIFSGRLRSSGFVGSYASILEHGAKLLEHLDLCGKPELVEFVRKRKAEIMADAARFRKSEENEHRQRDETYE